MPASRDYWLSKCALAVCLLAAAAGASAETREVKEARTGIHQAMDKVLAELRKGTTAEKTAELWYTKDLIISVSGGKFYRGMPEFMSTLAEWVKYPLCKWELDDASVNASGKMASAFLTETCAAQKAGDPDMVLKTLYVFEKTKAGWRASREAITVPKG